MANVSRSKSIVFIHGLFMNPKSWREWKAWFEARGYTCYTPANPFHEGEPKDLWKNINPGLGKVTFEQVVNHISRFISTLPEKPIVIGHSLAGLVVQKLIETDQVAAGVAIDGAAPPGIFTTRWSFWRSNFPVINYLRGNSVFKPGKGWFHYTFCNTMTREDSDKVFDEYVVPESRNIPRGTLKSFAKVNMRKAHKPLLFIAGEKDNIVPAQLNRNNFDAYTHKESVTEFREFQGRGHFICGAPGWQEVAGFIFDWLNRI